MCWDAPLFCWDVLGCVGMLGRFLDFSFKETEKYFFFIFCSIFTKYKNFKKVPKH
jgi:hypothetical protein